MCICTSTVLCFFVLFCFLLLLLLCCTCGFLENGKQIQFGFDKKTKNFLRSFFTIFTVSVYPEPGETVKMLDGCFCSWMLQVRKWLRCQTCFAFSCDTAKTEDDWSRLFASFRENEIHTFFLFFMEALPTTKVVLNSLQYWHSLSPNRFYL